eukprot:1651636-Pyramimonas_sp.AAC.1
MASFLSILGKSMLSSSVNTGLWKLTRVGRSCEAACAAFACVVQQENNIAARLHTEMVARYVFALSCNTSGNSNRIGTRRLHPQ